MVVGTGASLTTSGTGTITANALAAATYANAMTFSSATNAFTGVGTNLTALNATNLSSGSVAVARGGTGVATGLTVLDASNLSSGSVAVARGGTGVATGLTVLDATNLTSGTVAVARGGTGLGSGTDGGVLAFTAAGTLASSALLTNNAVMLGGGAGATPKVLGSLGTTAQVLHGNAAGAPSFGAVSLTADVTGTLPVGNGGTGLTTGIAGGVLGFSAAGTMISSAALTANRVVIGGGVALPSVLAAGTTAQVLHGNAAGAPTFGAVALATEVSGTLPVANGGTGLAAGISGGIPGYTAVGTITSSALLTNNALMLGGGAAATPKVMGSLGTNTQVLYGNAGGAPTWQTPYLTGTTAAIGGAIGQRVCVQGTAAVAGATTAMVAVASPAGTPPWATTTTQWTAWVSAANVVTVELCNNNNVANPAGTIAFNVRVLR